MRYRLKFLRMIITGIVLVACSQPALESSAKPQKPQLRSGQVVSASLNGYQSTNSASKSMRGHSVRDIWWNYVISSDDRIYSVVARENPAKSGLSAKSSFQFYEAKNWIYIPKPKGKPLGLKILNKSKKN
jgi:hypothetical protein